MVEVSTAREACGDAARLSGRSVVVHHHHHGDLIGRVPAARRAVGIEVVAPLEGEIIEIAPASLLQTAGEVVVQPHDVRDARIRELAEVLCVGVARERSTGFTEGLGFVEAVGINESDTLAGHVERVLPLFLRGVVAVVAVGVGYA